MPELTDRASSHSTRSAFRTPSGSVTYEQLLKRSGRCASILLQGAQDIEEERIAFLMPAGVPYAEVQWGIWRAGGIAVALNAGSTAPEIEHVLSAAGVRRVVVTAEAGEAVSRAAASVGAELLDYDRLESGDLCVLPQIGPERRAMIVFTSGTTSKPKGAVWTHGMLEAQIRALVSAWDWREEDCIPLFLPLHHVHGIVNVLCCALWSGACIEPFAGFQLDAVLARVRDKAYSVFMAVPTVYVKLVQALDAMSMAERLRYRDGFKSMRLMVSGSAALPASLHERWKKLTEQVLLERYGMTEIGMALSNPLNGERRPGSVGVALPAVEIRLVSEQGETLEGEDQPGEIWVRGPGVFQEYWGNPQASAEAFSDGWFRTGDVAVRERGYYRIMGRQSVDIIKSGGYKISALEIEHVLLSHAAIRECAVIGLSDATWGELVAVVAVPEQNATLDLQSLQQWCADKMSDYKQPRKLHLVAELPRNAMGKVLKPELGKLFGPPATS